MGAALSPDTHHKINTLIIKSQAGFTEELRQTLHLIHKLSTEVINILSFIRTAGNIK